MTGFDRHYEKDKFGKYNYIKVCLKLDYPVKTQREIEKKLIDFLELTQDLEDKEVFDNEGNNI